MTFLDTCVWLEVCATALPSSPADASRVQAASALLARLQTSGEIIVTCEEQLVEIIQAGQKSKLREFNRLRREGQRGAGNLKAFRHMPEFQNTKALCEQVISDVETLSQLKPLSDYPIHSIISNLHLVDINDYLYYQYCVTNNIDFYTFDGDFEDLISNGHIHILS